MCLSGRSPCGWHWASKVKHSKEDPRAFRHHCIFNRCCCVWAPYTGGCSHCDQGICSTFRTSVCDSEQEVGKEKKSLCLQNYFGPPQYVDYVSLVPVLFSHLSCHCYNRDIFSRLSFPSFYIGRIYLLWIFSLSYTVDTGRG